MLLSNSHGPVKFFNRAKLVNVFFATFQKEIQFSFEHFRQPFFAYFCTLVFRNMITFYITFYITFSQSFNKRGRKFSKSSLQRIV